jgi:hypothetical protein
MQTKFDFAALGEALRADTQAFIDTYAVHHPEDGPLLAFCLYFDSQGAATGMLLPKRATTAKKPRVTIDDVASWFQYGDHVEGQFSTITTRLFDEYEDWSRQDWPDGAYATVVEPQFKQMVTWVTQHLNFDKLPKTDDFIFFAEGMDEEYDEWQDTIPPALLKKHFDL